MQNEMRNRLVELLLEADVYDSYECKLCNDDYSCTRCYMTKFADHLIENGVIVPPCKLGSEIYMLVTRHTKSFEWENKKMFLQNNQHTFIKKTTFTKSNLFKVIEEFGKTVFLTKEEAEQALEEAEQKLKGGADNGK